MKITWRRRAALGAACVGALAGGHGLVDPATSTGMAERASSSRPADALGVPAHGLGGPTRVAVRPSRGATRPLGPLRTRGPADRPATPSPTPRASRSRPTTVSGRSRLLDGSAGWAAGADAQAVARCESGGNPRAVNPTGTYRGKWQMDAGFWATYGGLRFASSPEQAGEAQQDSVAYRGWLARGWQPWQCSSVLR